MLTAHSTSSLRYELREADECRAVIRMPTRPAMARNAAFSLGANGFVEIDASGRTARVEYETFDLPGTRPRLYRFFLLAGDTTVATATQQPGRHRRWAIRTDAREFELIERSRWFAMHFDVAGQVAGSVRETTRFLALQRRFAVDLPDELDVSLQAFVVFLAVNATYR